MGFSRALLCSCSFLLVVLSTASRDERMIEQREVTFDLAKIMQEMQDPDSGMLQKEVDLSDLLDLKGQQGFVPRSYGAPFVQSYPVQFPLARPSSSNLQAICVHSDHRPRYPESYFPSSGFGQQKRRASAVNKAESWFSVCCQGNATWGSETTLCCATQAWEQSVESFCQEDSSVKDRLYECCKKNGANRLNCFHKDAPNPSYNPTEELPVSSLPSSAEFTFDPNICQRSAMTPHSVKGSRKPNKPKKAKKPATSQKVDINFPLGRPTADTIESLCQNQRLRPLYSVKCLPGSDYDWLIRQAKTINRIEKGFKQCCKKKQGVLECAEQKWREEYNKFCGGTRNEQVDFHCCSAGDGADDRYKCFQDIAPDPHYNMTSENEEISLNNICDTLKILKKKFPGLPIKSFVNQCCPLSEQDKTNCFEQRIKETSDNLCVTKQAALPAFRRCCRTPTVPQCISKILMDAVTKATNVMRQKRRKRCPLS